MIKITPLRIIYSEEDINLKGTGRVKGSEVIPYTKSAITKLGLPNTILEAPAPIELPQGITENLRDYQAEDVSIMANRAVGMILSEPRTGKTPTAISIFKARNITKYIVVCPASIVYQWKTEIERWHGINAVVVKGTKKRRISTYEDWNSGVLVISYETLRNDFKEIDERNRDIQGMILDESHRINNRKTLQYKAVYFLSKKIPNRLALTGTLAPNKQDQIFGTLSVCYPEIFTSYWRFIDYYFETEKQMNWATRREYTEIGLLKHPTELQEFLERVSVNRTQNEVMKWIPEKDYSRIKLEPTRQQSKYIKSMLQNYEIEHEDTIIMAEGVLDQLMRVRQILNDPGLLDLPGKSPKTQWIQQYLKDYPETPVIIFSSFTSYLKKISQELEIPYMIIGETPSEKRELYKNMFQEGKINVLLINIQAGKEGLTLDRAHAAIFCDNYPPAADIMQAENRITATTKEMANKPNTIYQLMIEDTYDEVLYDLVESNTQESEVINKYKEYLNDRNTV